VDVSIFKDADSIDVSGRTKGKGFQGVMKRHGFGGGRKTHGSHSHRVPGSIGMAAYPGKVLKGQRLPGRTGGDTMHVKNLKIVEVDTENNLLLVKGAVPGARNAILRLTPPKTKKE
ncbi:MAG TPA: 50S ribosomal protein L3, partial [Candidatus Krumholzibacterium sp.]|nr:50S ribosomal protein L3 [Candidatus Krumholzibacterium sp.]